MYVQSYCIVNEDGSKFWHQNGTEVSKKMYHRIDGPAIEYKNGKKEWYFQGKYIQASSQEQFELILIKYKNTHDYLIKGITEHFCQSVFIAENNFLNHKNLKNLKEQLVAAQEEYLSLMKYFSNEYCFDKAIKWLHDNVSAELTNIFHSKGVFDSEYIKARNEICELLMKNNPSINNDIANLACNQFIHRL